MDYLEMIGLLHHQLIHYYKQFFKTLPNYHFIFLTCQNKTYTVKKTGEFDYTPPGQ